MPRETLTMVIDMPDRDGVREFVGKCAPLKGQYRFTVEPCRLSASQKQRGFYWGHVIQVFAAWLEDHGQPLPEGIKSYPDFAHAYLKEKCLKIPVMNRRGELKGHVTGSTSALDTEGMSRFTERARQLLWDTFQLHTDDPDPDWVVNRRSDAGEPTEAAA